MKNRGLLELIETLWNVNNMLKVTMKQYERINRNIVECKQIKNLGNELNDKN